MKTQLSISIDNDHAEYIRQLARDEYISVSESARQIIELGIKSHQGNEIPINQKIKLIENRIYLLQEQQKELAYQRDYLKDRIEEQ
jgi:predicted ATPase